LDLKARGFSKKYYPVIHVRTIFGLDKNSITFFLFPIRVLHIPSQKKKKKKERKE